MRLAFLSDLHGNLPALESALATAEAKGAERFVIAGDVVGGGPFPSETIARLRDDGRCDVIRGNVDLSVLKLARRKKRKKLQKRSAGNGKKANRAWTALALTQDDLAWLDSLPTRLAFEVAGSEVLVVHGSPRTDTEYIYPSITSVGLRRMLESHDGPEPRLLVSGHSHIPFAHQVEGTMVVNCGSVGWPADGDPRGAFAMADADGGGGLHVEIVRFTYPVDEAIAAIERLGVPGIDGEDYRQGLKNG
ncbi:MAG: metallophosphoesterase family protein [Gemmatimonadota bacterium]